MMELFLVNGLFDRFAGLEEEKETNGESEDYDLNDYLDILNEYRDAEADILINIATIYFEDDNMEESLKYLEEAIVIYDGLDYLEKKALVMDIMGDIYFNTGDKRTALEYYKEAYKLYSETDSETDSESKGNIISKINETEKDLVSADSKPKLTNVKTKKTPPAEVITDDYIGISKEIEEVLRILNGANTYMSYANHEDPFEQLQNAYEMSSGIGDNDASATILMIKGNLTLKDSKPDEALEDFNKGLELFKLTKNFTGEAVAMLLIGTVYYLTGYMQLGAENFRKSIELLRQIKNIPGEEKAIELMNTIYEE
ncbi:MAG: tetratricopeptide repeat protein [Methanobacterium sp.]|nr:tetratricopeptide repeat protein [Methanobacterium sp.]